MAGVRATDAADDGSTEPMNDTPEATWPLTDAQPGQVVVIARWSPGPGSRDTVLATLTALVRASRDEPGCLGYQVFHPDGTDDGDIVLVERYEDRAALQAHRDSPHFRDLALERVIPLLRDRHAVVTTVV
ncbi:putative quinol monooxygenase [Streptomyces sp. NPDC001902]